MTASDWIVLLLVAAGVAAAVRRNLRKGIPCESGGCSGACGACRRRGAGGCPGRKMAEKAKAALSRG